MENKEVFTYRYSAKQNKEIEHIRSKYLPKEQSKLDILRSLDSRVQNAGMLHGLIIGIVGCLIFGVGMCFGLDVFSGASWLSVLFCTVGVATMIPAYPIYRHVAKKVKQELSPEILRLSEEIMNS